MTIADTPDTTKVMDETNIRNKENTNADVNRDVGSHSKSMVVMQRRKASAEQLAFGSRVVINHSLLINQICITKKQI